MPVIGTCSTTGKQSHASQSAARNQMLSLQKRDRKSTRMSVYYCQDCTGWHVGHEGNYKPKKGRR